MSETFEEWFKEDGNGDFNYFSRDYYAGQWAPLIKHAWNHQQKKIVALQAEVDALRNNNKELLDQRFELMDKVGTLTSQLEKLTKCSLNHYEDNRNCITERITNLCQGCKNKKLLEAGE